MHEAEIVKTNLDPESKESTKNKKLKSKCGPKLTLKNQTFLNQTQEKSNFKYITKIQEISENQNHFKKS